MHGQPDNTQCFLLKASTGYSARGVGVGKGGPSTEREHFIAIYAVLSRRHDCCKIRAFPGTLGVVPRHFQLLLMSDCGIVN